MSVAAVDARGLGIAGSLLNAAEAVVVACPSPLPYAVVASNPVAVNTVKGRPAEQPLGMGVADLDLVLPYLEPLDAATLRFARWLSGTELVSIMLPAAATTARWLAPSIAGGYLGVTLAWHPDVRSLLDERGHVYMSSANRSGRQVALTAAQADAEFGGDLLVLDSDAHRDPVVESGSATIVRVTAGLTLQLQRPGINNATYGDDVQGFLDDLRARWLASEGRSTCAP